MKNNYYIYPAIFNYDDMQISISFPDLPGCFSCGKDDEEALLMAKDALRLYLILAKEDGEKLNLPSKLKDINLKQNERVVLIEVNIPVLENYQ